MAGTLTNSGNAPSASEISSALAAEIEQIAAELIPHGKRRGAEWVAGNIYGDPGKSFSLRISGAKKGVWSDFQTGQRGDALDLLAWCKFQGDKKMAYRWGCKRLGYNVMAPEELKRFSEERRISKERHARDEAQERKRTINRARNLFFTASPLQPGDPVVCYLAGRNITLLPGQFPRSLRFHSSIWNTELQQFMPAMLGAISNRSGRVIALHQTYLERHNGQWRKAGSVKAVKKFCGPVSGNFIRIATGDSGRKLKDISETEEIIIGEGIETCLSVALSCPEYRVLCACSLSNLGSLLLPNNARHVLLLGDNDTNEAAQKAFQKAIQSYLERGIHVRVARAPIGSDFNDTLREVNGG